MGWGKGDVLLARGNSTDPKSPLKFFVQKDNGEGADYRGRDDIGTKGGILRFKVDGLDGKSCPTDPSRYKNFFYPTDGMAQIEPGDAFCVITRDGKRYALLQVEALCENGLVFTYRYNGTDPKFPADVSSSTESPGSSEFEVRQVVD